MVSLLAVSIIVPFFKNLELANNPISHPNRNPARAPPNKDEAIIIIRVLVETVSRVNNSWRMKNKVATIPKISPDLTLFFWSI
jgi:hypothetical protein